MAVSPEFRDYVLDQLRAITPVRPKPMFGCTGIYTGGTFFALIADDVVYFKVDDTTRRTYVERGSVPFTPFGKPSKGYYQLPEDILEDTDELRTWVREAVLVARRKKK